MEKNVDFSECRFIDDNMRYYTYIDFYNKRKKIKKMYSELSNDGKLFYKWYVYANIHMNETYKNLIWDFLNNYDDNGFELLRYKQKYKAR